jgi:hypothetical protein
MVPSFDRVRRTFAAKDLNIKGSDQDAAGALDRRRVVVKVPGDDRRQG